MKYFYIFLLYLGLGISHAFPQQISCSPTNKALLQSHLKALAEHQLGTLPIQEIAVKVGTRFLSTPYEAGTLEGDEGEKLVVHLSGLDCTTFLENVVVMARLARMDQCDFEDFLSELEYIRYRKGEMAGYPSRLHYFSEWLSDNSEKGVLVDISQEIGGIPYDKQIDFMSTHRTAYPALVDDGFYAEIQQIEKEVNTKNRFFIPKEEVAELEKNIQSGDILAITTSINGLDVSHTGMALREKGRIYLLHASSSSNKVEVSSKPLADYLMGNKKQSGIMVARLR